MQSNILIVDDHPFIVEGLVHLIESYPELKVVATANTGGHVIEQMSENEIDLYILDINLPDISGFDLIEAIRKKDNSAPIIIHTMHEEIWYVNRMIAMGVNGIVLKSSATSQMMEAIKKVLEGNVYTCERFAKVKEKLQSQLDLNNRKTKPTRREMQVLELIADGLNTCEIADKLEITENTVETFRKRLIQKFSAKNSIDLVVMAIERGFLKDRKSVV